MKRHRFALLPLIVLAHQALATESSRPHVVNGSATFHQNGPNWQINTHKNKTIINWHSFGVPGGSTTTFNQPKPSSAVLNRVTGPLGSGIHGSLLSNGKVFLINPNGIVVGKHGVVNTRGFVASTLDVKDGRFLRGGTMPFAGNSDAAVVNLGRVTASGGDVILIGAQVRNHGVIKAEDGKVAMVAARGVALTQDHQVFILPSDRAVGGSGVENTGDIRALRAELQAQGNLYALAINNEGDIHATGVVREHGRVLLRADGGAIRNTGTLSARTVKKNGKTIGGEIQILAETAILEGNAALNVSGDLGGGQINVGGSFQGKGPLPNAKQVWVGDGVSIKANALQVGDGGSVILWADHATWFYGKLEAKGGPHGGNGGFAEVSGKAFLEYRGHADLTAPQGTLGTLLLDPANGNILDGMGDGDDGDALDNTFAGDLYGVPGQVLADENTPTTIYESELEGMAATANVIIQMTGDLTLQDLSDNLLSLNLTTGSLTLIADADGDSVGAFTFVDHNDVIRTEGGAVNISGAQVTLLGGIDTTGASGAQTGGSITITSTDPATTIDVGNELTTTGLVTINSAGGADGTAVLSGDGLLLLGGGKTHLNTAVNTIATGNLGNGSVNISNGGTLAVGSLGGNSGITAGGGISLTTTAGAGIILDAALDVGGETINLKWNGTLTQNTGGSLTAGLLNLVGGAGANLNLDLNGVAEVGTLATGLTGTGTVQLTSAGSLVFSPFNANDNTLIVDCAGATGGTVAANALELLGTGTFALDTDVNALAANVDGGLALSNLGALDVDTVAGTSGIRTNGNDLTLITGDALSLNSAIDTGDGTVSLRVTANGATQEDGGSIQCGGLALSGSGHFILDRGGNRVPLLAANTSGGDLVVLTNGNISVGSVGSLSGIAASSAALLSLTAPGGYVELLAPIQANGSGSGELIVKGDVRPSGSLSTFVLPGSGTVQLIGQTVVPDDPGTVIPPPESVPPYDGDPTNTPAPYTHVDGQPVGNLTPPEMPLQTLISEDEWELKMPKELIVADLTLDEIFKMGFVDEYLPAVRKELQRSKDLYLMVDEVLVAASRVYHVLPDNDPVRPRMAELMRSLKYGQREVRVAVGRVGSFLKSLYLEKKRDPVNQDAFNGALKTLRLANEALELDAPVLQAFARGAKATYADVTDAERLKSVQALATRAMEQAQEKVTQARKRRDQVFKDVLLFSWQEE